MIELNVSSRRACTLRALMQMLAAQKVVARVVKTESTVSYRDSPDADEQVRIEQGFYLLIHNVEAKDFRARVWAGIELLMPVECAHVRDGDRYMGCLSNWPGVMAESRCNQQGLPAKEMGDQF
jgi:hypothetical protein